MNFTDEWKRSVKVGVPDSRTNDGYAGGSQRGTGGKRGPTGDFKHSKKMERRKNRPGGLPDRRWNKKNWA